MCCFASVTFSLSAVTYTASSEILLSAPQVTKTNRAFRIACQFPFPVAFVPLLLSQLIMFVLIDFFLPMVIVWFHMTFNKLHLRVFAGSWSYPYCGLIH